MKYIQIFLYEPGKPGETIVTRCVRWEHWDHPYNFKSTESLLFTKVEGLKKKLSINLQEKIH
jgi:hypothetical protein